MATLHHISRILLFLGLTPCLLGQEVQPCTTEQQLLRDLPCLSPDGNMVMTKDQYDALLSDKSIKSKRQASKSAVLWPGGVIPYEFFYGDFNDEDRFRVEEAMYLWEFGTCITFRPATSSDKSKIRFQGGKNCTSRLGMQEGVSKISLNNPKCRNRGDYLHQLGHTLGMVHTHLRPDRDDHIKLVLENIASDKKNPLNISKYTADNVDTHGIPYDYDSIMHLGVKTKSDNGALLTITTLDPDYQHFLRYVMYKWLSFNDIKLANLMYQCNKHCPADPKCKAPGYLNKDCKCICPNGKDCGYGVKYCPKDYQDPRCDQWFAKDGCQSAHRMALYCPRRCGRDDCKDWIKETCKPDADAGKCSTDKFMVELCKMSCDACKKDPPISAGCPTFKLFETPPMPPPTTTPGPITTTGRTLGNCRNRDTDRRCDPLALRGDCEFSPWMRINCARSCNTCPGTCNNMWAKTECERKQRDGDCITRETWMRTNCAKTCKMCVPKKVCQDTNVNCNVWVQSGYCGSSARTAEHCQKSCGFCT